MLRKSLAFEIKLLLQPIYQVTQNASSLESIQNKIELCSRPSCSANCSLLIAHDSARRMVLEEAREDKDAVERYSESQAQELVQILGRLEQC